MIRTEKNGRNALKGVSIINNDMPIYMHCRNVSLIGFVQINLAISIDSVNQKWLWKTIVTFKSIINALISN